LVALSRTPEAAVSVVETLRRVPLFAQLAPDDLQRVAAVARDRPYPRNSVIVFEDDPGDALFVVAAGQVKVVLVGEDGREVILAVLGPGDFFGELALIDDEPRSAHVIAMDDARLLVLRRDDFQRALEAHPRIALGLLRALSRRLRRADDKIGALVLLDVYGRVARVLLELAADTPSGDRIHGVTHATMAQMIGSSRETVSRTLGHLADRGLIVVSRDGIHLTDRAALRAAARLS
jgi:CRP/FNR family transcriptional regulator, cyclic AMP receptor protein